MSGSENATERGLTLFHATLRITAFESPRQAARILRFSIIYKANELHLVAATLFKKVLYKFYLSRDKYQMSSYQSQHAVSLECTPALRQPLICGCLLLISRGREESWRRDLHNASKGLLLCALTKAWQQNRNKHHYENQKSTPLRSLDVEIENQTGFLRASTK